MKYLFCLVFILSFQNQIQSQTPKGFSDQELITKISYYDSIIKIRPFSGEYHNRGYLFFLANRFDESLSDYNKAIDLDSKNHEIYFRRAQLKNALKDYNGAKSDYSNVIQLDSKNYNAFYNRGLIKKELHDFSGAFSDFTKAIEIDPKNLNSYINRGNLYMGEEKFTEAIKDFDKTIELDPSNLEAIQNRGISKANIGDKSALKDFNKLILLDPSGEAYLNRAIFYINNNYKLDYCSDLRKAISLGSESAKDFLKQHCK